MSTPNERRNNGSNDERRVCGGGAPSGSPGDEGREPTPIKIEDIDPYDDYQRLIQIDLTNLDKSILKPSHVKLPVLKAHNYRVWAQCHERFLESRGMWPIVTGELAIPEELTQAKNWIIVDRWIATLLDGHLEDTQKGHIANIRRSRDVWAKLKSVHRVSGKGRLAPMYCKNRSTSSERSG